MHKLKTREGGRLKKYRHLFLWHAIGWIMLIVVLVLFLIPIPPSVEVFSYEDKIYHALVFSALCIWYLQLYSRPILIAIAFMLFGLMVEWLQSFTSYRSADIWDFASDAVGIVVGLMLYRTVFGKSVKLLDIGLERIIQDFRKG